MGAYGTVTSNPTITLNSVYDGSGVDGKHGCLVIGVGLNWSSNLRKIPTIEGSKSIPDIPKGQIAVELLIPPSGTSQGAASCPMYLLTSCALVDINGVKYYHTFHTGGGLRIQDFGEGIQALVLTKRYAVFGQATGG
jgi:hypothetical protein